MPCNRGSGGGCGLDRTPRRSPKYVADQHTPTALRQWSGHLSPAKVTPKAKVPQPSRLPALTETPLFPRPLGLTKALSPVAVSKAPLAAQLEAFIRREYKIYTSSNPDCTHADTLHIVREAFSVIIEHFTEYREVFLLIRDEYEAAFEELSHEVRRLFLVELETNSARSLHATEIVKQRENFKSIVSNHYAQLQATKGIVHSLRDQIITHEEANAALRAQLEKAKEETRDATNTSKMLTKAMVEEAARNRQHLEIRNANQREIGRLKAQVDMVKDELKDVEGRYTALLEKTLYSNREDALRRGSRTKKKLEEECEISAKKRLEEYEENAKRNSLREAENENCGREAFHLLTKRIDGLLLERKQLKAQLAAALEENNPVGGDVSEKSPPQAVTEGAKQLGSQRLSRASIFTERTDGTRCGSVASEGVRRVVDASHGSSAVDEWMREEQLTPRELDKLHFLLPPGRSEEHPFGFLNAAVPVRNRFLKRRDVIDLLERFWDLRRDSFDACVKRHFMCWLHKTTGSEFAGQELGVNILNVCEQNQLDPDCRAFMLIFRETLPEDIVHVFRKEINFLEVECRNSAGKENFISTDMLYDKLRVVFREKTYFHMLEVRFYLWRQCGSTGTISLDDLFDKDSCFVRMLKKQFIREVEEFTLIVTEAIRSVALDADTVRLHDVTKVLSAQDPEIPQGTLHRLVAEAAQVTSMDVARSDVDYTVKLRPLLYRYRTAVLLRRVSPPVVEDDIFTVSSDGRAADCDGA